MIIEVHLPDGRAFEGDVALTSIAHLVERGALRPIPGRARKAARGVLRTIRGWVEDIEIHARVQFWLVRQSIRELRS